MRTSQSLLPTPARIMLLRDLKLLLAGAKAVSRHVWYEMPKASAKSAQLRPTSPSIPTLAAEVRQIILCSNSVQPSHFIVRKDVTLASYIYRDRDTTPCRPGIALLFHSTPENSLRETSRYHGDIHTDVVPLDVLRRETISRRGDVVPAE